MNHEPAKSLDKNLAAVLDYHQRTKHHFHRFAASLEFMDWSTQPDPFRKYEETELVRLPLLAAGSVPLYEHIFIPNHVPPSPVTKESIGQFFELSLAISAWKQYQETRWALRVNPSSGNLHPTEGYLILPFAVHGINSTPMVYHYSPKEHGLEKRGEFSERLNAPINDQQFFIGLTSIYWREAWKYGERAFRYCQHDCGHAYAAIAVAAQTLGWQIEICDSPGDGELAALIGLQRTGDFIPDELEAPEVLIRVIPQSVRNPDPGNEILAELINKISSVHWFGRANALSTDHHSWEAITHVDLATRKPPTGARDDFPIPAVPSSERPEYPKEFSAYQVIKKRRSAVDMDGSTQISPAEFYQILSRVQPPVPGVPWAPKIHLCLFVHRVAGLPSGIYILVRDHSRLADLRQTMHPDFLWRKPDQCPKELELYLLATGNFQEIAKTVSCAQDIAGDGVFSLGMLAEFAGPLNRHGPWFYKRLFWETGMIGQWLYLEAEAIGISATGIGCFFDDAMHELLGIKGTGYQSLYHFTLGRAVVDKRLSTLPAYDIMPNSGGERYV